MKNKPNIYLVGFMGTGKSAVGRQLAQLLRIQFIDSDQAIEQQEGRSIAAIFAAEGEAYFRNCERQFVVSGHAASGLVVSCGGGLVIQAGMLKELKQKGVVIGLTANADTILQRTRTNTARPLLNVTDPKARIEELLAEREPYYAQADISIMTDNRPIREVALQAERYYRSRL